jgi:hypothetical protein
MQDPVAALRFLNAEELGLEGHNQKQHQLLFDGWKTLSSSNWLPIE